METNIFKTQQTGVKATGNVDVTANVGIAGNAYVGTYLAVANTNPAATDALVVGGNVRIAAGSLIFADGTSCRLVQQLLHFQQETTDC